jgi:hypothetical protein
VYWIAFVCKFVFACEFVGVCLCAYVLMCLWEYICVCVCLCMSLWEYVCVRLCALDGVLGLFYLYLYSFVDYFTLVGGLRCRRRRGWQREVLQGCEELDMRDKLWDESRG